MDIKQVKDIMKLMKEHKLTELEIEQDGFKIKLKKSNGARAKELPLTQQIPVAVPQAPQVQAPPAQSAQPAAAAPSAEDDPSVVIVKAPMVGTYYHAPAPNAKPFVQVGQDVSVDDTLCIIEAMKLMNEIKSEVNGKLLEILVTNGQAVEFDQPMFKIKKA